MKELNEKRREIRREQDELIAQDAPQRNSESIDGSDPRLLQSIYLSGFSARTALYLQGEQVLLIGNLIQRTDIDLLKIPTITRGRLQEIERILHQMGLRLGMTVTNWPPKKVPE